jgi:hypothetical protein
MISQPKVVRRSLLSLPRLSMTHLFVLTVLVGIFAILNLSPILPNDFWWHLQAGREIAMMGHIPLGDTLAYTIPGIAYSNYNAYWLAELAMYGLYTVGGLPLVVFAKSLVVEMAYGLLLWLSSRIAGDARNGYRCTVLAAAVGFFNWNVRPQVIAFPLFVACLIAIYEYRRRPRLVWLVVFPLAILVWVNSHGSYVIGLLLLGIWLLDEMWLVIYRGSHDIQRKLRGLVAPSAALGISVLVCLLNPRGFGTFSYFVAMLRNPVVQVFATEWASPSFAYPDGVVFLATLLLSAVLLIVSPKRATTFQLLMWLAFVALGLKSRRYTIWFGFVVAAILADHLPGIVAVVSHSLNRRESGGNRDSAKVPTRAGGRWVLNYGLAGAMLLIALVSLPWTRQQFPILGMQRPLLSAVTPVGATHFLLEKRPAGRLFNFADFGSYLIWAAQPDYPVFIDLRLEMYSPEFVNEYVLISNAVGNWEHKLEGYGVNILMLSPQEQPNLIKAASQSPHWKQVYSDQAAIIFVRSDSASQ